MARAAENDAQGASDQYKGYATAALNNYNTQASKAGDDISALEGKNPYTDPTYLKNQNIETSGAMNASNAAAKENLNNAALRTGTNTAALGRTISSNARASQRTMDNMNAQRDTNNQDKYVQLQQNLIGQRQNLANSEAGVLGTTSGQQTAANGQMVQLQGQNTQMWGNIIAGAAGAAGSAFAGKG